MISFFTGPKGDDRHKKAQTVHSLNSDQNVNPVEPPQDDFF